MVHVHLPGATAETTPLSPSQLRNHRHARRRVSLKMQQHTSDIRIEPSQPLWPGVAVGSPGKEMSMSNEDQGVPMGLPRLLGNQDFHHPPSKIAEVERRPDALLRQFDEAQLVGSMSPLLSHQLSDPTAQSPTQHFKTRDGVMLDDVEVCHICSEGFLSKDRLFKHVRDVHRVCCTATATTSGADDVMAEYRSLSQLQIVSHSGACALREF